MNLNWMDYHSEFVYYLLIVFYCITRIFGFSIILSLLIMFTVFQSSKIIDSYFKEQMIAIREHYGLIEIDSEKVNY